MILAWLCLNKLYHVNYYHSIDTLITAFKIIRKPEDLSLYPVYRANYQMTW